MIWLGYFMMVMSCIAGVLMHCYTVFWVYATEGMGWAFVAFCTPPFSELIMAGASIAEFGVLNKYFVVWLSILTVYGVADAMIRHKKQEYAD